jgi:hypothetical protein
MISLGAVLFQSLSVQLLFSGAFGPLKIAGGDNRY